MLNQADYSKYKCPYSHVEKEFGHELIGPEGYADTYSVWCMCGYRGPVFCLDPIELKLELKESPQETSDETGTSPNNARDVICPVTAISCTHGRQQVVCVHDVHCFHKEQAKLSPVA